MFSFLLGVHAVSGISELDSKCTIKFIRNCKLFSKVTIPFLILIGNCRQSSCSTYFLTVCIVSLFIFAILLQKMGPFQGLGVGSCLTLRNELSKETHKLTKQKTLLGKVTCMESSRLREPGECSAMWLSVSGFVVMELASR